MKQANIFVTFCAMPNEEEFKMLIINKINN